MVLLPSFETNGHRIRISRHCCLLPVSFLAHHLPNTLMGTDLVFHTKYLQFRGYGWWLHVYLMGLRHCTCACDLWNWSQKAQTSNWLVYKLVNYTRLVLGTFFKRKKFASCSFQALNITRLSCCSSGQMKYIYIPWRYEIKDHGNYVLRTTEPTTAYVQWKVGYNICLMLDSWRLY